MNFLIMKRDLYYRPQGAGYTGIKDHAGRYTLEEVALEFPNRDSAQQDGISFIPEDEAPDYTKACFWDLREKHIAEKLTKALSERDATMAALERDRTTVAETINAVRSEIAGREWLIEGRGPYEWDDDRYRAEFSDAITAIRGPIEKLGDIARDWTNCPTDPAKIKAARDGLINALKNLNAACDAMWNDPQRGQIKEQHMKAISEAQQASLNAINQSGK